MQILHKASRVPFKVPVYYAHASKGPQYYMDLEHHYGCHNYHPIPVVLSRAKGVNVWDVEGKRYFDYLAAYSAVNQGHCHPRIINALKAQADVVTLTSRAFHSDKLGVAEEFLTKKFKYDKVLFMNTGVEAGESAVKFARRWAYDVKKVPENQARVLFANGNFWGRTIAACGSSDDPDRYRRFGPFGGLNFDLVDYDNVEALEAQFKTSPNYAAFMVEPIQGEMGVVMPKPGYLEKVRALCNKYNVLLIIDEIQAGLGRSGKWFAYEWENVRPDMVLLGKALSGGCYPVSAVLADNAVMDNIKPGEHGSTYGGNPMACAVSIEAIKVLEEEGMIENSRIQGERLLDGLKQIKHPKVKAVRGRGLWCAMDFVADGGKEVAWNYCLKLMENGLLAKPTHSTTIRFSPPLCITKEQVDESIHIIQKSLKGF